MHSNNLCGQLVGIIIIIYIKYKYMYSDNSSVLNITNFLPPFKKPPQYYTIIAAIPMSIQLLFKAIH